jgi:hypothetical protein
MLCHAVSWWRGPLWFSEAEDDGTINGRDSMAGCSEHWHPSTEAKKREDSWTTSNLVFLFFIVIIDFLDHVWLFILFKSK